MAELSFGQVEAVLAAVYEIQDHKRVAFAGRLKMLQKNGLPTGARPGRGKAGTYSFPHLLQLAVGVEMLQFGLAPQRAASMVAKSWPTICHSTNYALIGPNGELDYHPDVNFLWMVRPTELSDLQPDHGSVLADYASIEPIAKDRLAYILSGPGFVPGLFSSVEGAMLMPAGRIIHSLLWHTVVAKYLSLEHVGEQLRAAEKEFNDGVIALTVAPWEVEWTIFEDDLLDERLIDLRVQEIIDRAPREQISFMAKMLDEGLTDLWAQENHLMMNVARWGTMDRDRAGNIFLTRVGRALCNRFTELREAAARLDQRTAGGQNVDQKA